MLPEADLSKVWKGFADMALNQDVINISNLVFNLRRLGLFVSIFLILGILFFFIRLKNLNRLETKVKKVLAKPKLNDKAIKHFFVSINKKFKEDNMLIAKLALAEVEHYFDKTLEEVGFKGKTLTDKLEHIKEKFMPNIEQIKLAHQQIKTILDTEDYQLTDVEANEITKVYIEGIENLKKL